MGSQPEVIAYHGWGFDSTCWRSWRAKFELQGWRFQTFDRGYFGHPNEASFKQSKKILLTHSYGLHLCPSEQLQQADLLIIFSSFSEFHPQQKSLRRRSQAVLKTMLNQLEANPLLVLKNFRAKCYFPQPEEMTENASSVAECNSECPLNPPELGDLGGERIYNSDRSILQFSNAENSAYNLELLMSDLKDLDNSSITFDELEQIPKIIFQGAKDQIVSPHQGKTLLKSLENNAQYIEIADAGHALPFTHFQTCWSVLSTTHAAYFA